MKKNRILVMMDGKRVRVTGENGKWWLTDGGIFRKGNTQIAAIEEETVTGETITEVQIPERTLVEEIAEVKNEVEEPKKKATTRKKKAEPKTEE